MNTYLLQIQIDGEVFACIRTKAEIIDRIDMLDCTDEELKVYKVDVFGCVEPLEIYGCWHNPKEPLYIKVVDTKGNIVFDGYGTDHKIRGCTIKGGLQLMNKKTLILYILK